MTEPTREDLAMRLGLEADELERLRADYLRAIQANAEVARLNCEYLEQIARLRAALESYGQHLPDCDKLRYMPRSTEVLEWPRDFVVWLAARRCTCGLEKALANDNGEAIVWAEPPSVDLVAADEAIRRGRDLVQRLTEGD